MKSESEKFAGALRTYSIEALMGDGRALQAGTSHNLGQNFAKAFDITFQARDKSVQHVWGTSWGMTTRLVGAVIMVHGDDSGLVLPPRVAPYQVVSCRSAATTGAKPCCRKRQEIQRELVAAGIRVTLDERDERPGWKFAEWELRGVPLRLEIGPKDIEKSAVLVARRDTREKQSLPMEGLAARIRGAARRRCSRTCSQRAISSAKSTRSASTATRRSSRRWKAAPVSSSRHGAGRPSAKRRSRPTRRRRFATCRWTARRRPGTCIRCDNPATAEAWFAKAY